MASSSTPPSSAPDAASAAEPKAQNHASPARRPRPSRPNYRHIHRFPFPVAVHPLPPLIPHNPLSLVSVLLSYLTFFISPPHRETYSAYFDGATSSVHVTDPKAIKALWEMGFFGKGTLSRSEPSWLEREKKRRGLLGGMTSEEVTRQRRTERRELKLERARMEKLAIEERLKAEAAARDGDVTPVERSSLSPTPNGVPDGPIPGTEKFSLRKAREAKLLESQRLVSQDGEAHAPGTPGKRRSPSGGKTPVLNNEEHLQLSPEEAFFLVYGLGALRVLDDTRKEVLPTSALLPLFCRHSYFPPRDPSVDLAPDDSFMISYVVYHHFRSLGWVVRSGVKFGVDYILYNRGPVFSHAEFAVVVIPSYDHPYWSETADRRAHCAEKQARSWWWLHCVNRVQAQVKKSLVVCYVEVPPPTSYELDTPSEEDIGAMLARYQGTQQDSLDIAELQRVALGPLDVNGSGIAQNHVHEQDAQKNSPSHFVVPDVQKSPSKPGRGPSSCRSPTRPQNAPSAVNPNPSSSEPRSRSCAAAPVALSGKMSAESAPSDTQVVSQSVYDEIIRKNHEAAQNAPDSNLGDHATLMTLHEGDSGHLDLLSGYDHIHTDAANMDDLDDQSSSKLGESSPMFYQPNLFPESQRFLAKTPVAAVKRAHSDGLATVSPSASRNPLATDVGSSGGIMALSQVFRATQAPSSPLVHGLNLDLASDRPSPNIPIQSHPLATTLSSPYNRLAATFRQESPAHRLSYISMQESQANRDQAARERMTRSVDQIYSDHSDGEFDKEPSFVERMRRRKMVDEEAAAQLVACTAPARPNNRRERQTSTSTDPMVKASEWTDGPVVDGEDQESGTTLRPVVLSEEETEQELEDGLNQPVPHSQPNSSTEEDKENCHDPATIAPATSAHDRLSQALALQSLYSSDGEAMGEHRGSRQRSRSIVPDEQLPATGRSSQISVVKDSQRSRGNLGHDDREQWNMGRKRHPGSQVQLDPSSDVERITSSPTKQVRIRSSPPSGSQRNKRSFELGGAEAASPTGSDSGSPRRSPTPRASAFQGNMIQSNNSAVQRPTGMGERPSTHDSREKSSSMPSRVVETPVAPRNFAEVVPMTSIPETSPSRLGHQGWANDLNDTADQEDDDLPPVYVDAHERGPHSQPIMSDSSSPVKPSSFHNSKILSSPSGRQRRALTEIAADDPPQLGTGPFSLDINILSADDREFRSAVAMSPAPPRKRRRGNDGQSFYASDPVLPVTPHPATHVAPPQGNSMATIPEMEPAEPETKPLSTFQRRSRPARRTASLWDMDDSPQYHGSRKEKSKLMPRSRLVGRQPAKTERSEKIHEEQPVIPDNQIASSVPEPLSESNGPDSAETTVENEPITEEAPRIQPPVQAPVQTPVQTPVNTDNVPIAVNQVLAPWSGPKRAYYPATCVGKAFGTQQPRYLIKFEDSVPVEIPPGAVKRLELRVGDGVKVDMPNVPKVTHIISGFANTLSIEDIEQAVAKGTIPMTDVYGHLALILTPKQRKSLPSAGLAVTETRITVPVAHIYLDTILWNQLKDRAFRYDSGPVPSESRLQTPADRHSTPISPGSRLSRSIRLATGLFSGMVFAVSFGDNQDAKSRVAKMISENDGRILEDGFNELFELPLNAPVATPTKLAPPATQDGYLRLASGAADVGFACLIADNHSRRPKYMQALALNLPCLSDRWVEDCVAKKQLLDWEMYLLPAGESTYLNGATKSRLLAPYPTTEARLSETIAGRPNLLNGQSVLLVTGRSGRTEKEKRKRETYLFLTYALGASRVERVPDLKTAREILNTQADGETNGSGWDWVYVDDDDRLSAKAMTSGAGSRKRKRSRPSESMSENDLGLGTNVKIVGNDFVCQSLILGRLFDQ
ncbi:hypothetical protein BO71DRAFT_472604 [Aspergillus ellipticus CBS 707.79]|uniref:tRNA-intron lyase n=1 Tax=Aspergillus ellipticus CBS 707.79 TaxID=1448320 RepID=A0A319DFS7_9EURO|nr:hypothetical protein BO71DRAFT_472604 [Aspergillus ellipticus CBS 707.79]